VILNVFLNSGYTETRTFVPMLSSFILHSILDLKDFLNSTRVEGINVSVHLFLC